MALHRSEAGAKAGPGIHCSGYLLYTPNWAILQPIGNAAGALTEVPRILREHWLRDEDLHLLHDPEGGAA